MKRKPPIDREAMDCARVRELDLVDRYVSEELDARTAEAFELHYFQCERCWSELETALSLRAAMADERSGSPAARGAPADRPPGERGGRPGRRSGVPRVPRWASAAAALVAVGLGLWIWGPSAVRDDGPLEPRLRGAASGLELTVDSDADGWQMRWSQVPGSERYVVQLFDPAGTRMLELETAETSMSLGTEALGSSLRSGGVVRVQALDAAGQVRASSDFLEVGAPRSP